MIEAKVLVLYPESFGCLPKFVRKVNNILSRLEAFQLACFDDPRGFLAEIARDERCTGIEKVESVNGSSHAVVFDDGEEFSDELSAIKQIGIPYRLIPIKITRVINIKKNDRLAGVRSTPDYEYIGRGSDWGNPYSMFDSGAEDGVDSRDEVIRKFKYDFDRGLLKLGKDDALKLSGKRLGCFCKPEACHGDVIAEYLNCYDDGE